jgi:hypothetical protein
MTTAKPYESLQAEILAEVLRASEKSPAWPSDPIHAAAIVGEEAGKLTMATLKACYEPRKYSPDDVRAEAIQTAAMCLRFLRSFDDMPYSFKPGPQHHWRDNPTLNIS